MQINKKSFSPSSRRRRTETVNQNLMKKEAVIPFVIGLLVGAMFVVFFQFNARLNNNAMILSQLDQATAANTKNVNDVITFINGLQAPAGTPTSTPAAN